MIQLQGVSYSYGEQPALRNIDLEIPRGDAVAVIGPNASGKSTLLRLLSAVVVPTSGCFLFEGEPITRQRMREQVFAKRFHQRVGLVFQNPEAQLFCPSVEEEVAFGPRQMGLPEKEVQARTVDCLALMGIQGLADRPPWHVSGGEKRKVAVASVLALNPDVLVLDEPMNGLDPRTKRFLRDLIRQLHGAGKTILCATHDFPYVEGVFRTAVVLSEDHRVIRVGPYDEVLEDRSFLESNNIL